MDPIEESFRVFPTEQIPDTLRESVTRWNHAIPDVRPQEHYYPEVRKHIWKGTRIDQNDVVVTGGYVFGENGSFVYVEDAEFAAPEAPDWVWLEITVTEGTLIVTAASLQTGEEVPENTPTTIYRPVISYYNLYPDGNAYYSFNQIETSDIYLCDSEALLHPWKVTPKGTTDGEGDFEFSVKGDTVYCPTGNIVVNDTTVSGTAKYVVLEISRDSDSRAITGVVVSTAESVADDDYNIQYRAIAYIIDERTVRQIQFEEIRLHELLLVENGEFKLCGFEISHRTTYAPPS